ncbi:MAG: radical SAM protein [Planctomycetes bacterium]|nr:radical SAM protein [Planctomycetota bacterium]
MNILLINPPAERTSDFPPLGLLSVGTVLKQAGYNVSILDAPLDGLETPAILKIAGDSRPDLIGITTFIVNEPQILDLVRALKKEMSCPIMLGGPHASSYPQKLMEKEHDIDVIVVKEGEKSALEFVRALDEGTDWGEVQGLVFRTGNGEIVTTTSRPIEKNMDVFPIPDRSLVKLDAYQPIPSMYKRFPITSIITSRGCPFRCTYCFEAGVLSQKYRRRSVEKAMEEIKYLVRDYGIREIAFWDDEFVINSKWVHAFCDALITGGMDITWSCFGRVGSVTVELLRHMNEAGCWSISYGIESGNQETLDFIKKGFTLEQVREAVRWAHEAGIETRCSFMLALPGETPEMGQKTIDFAIELDLDYAQFFATNPLPGTPLYEDSHGLGTRTPNMTNYGFSRPFRAPFVPNGYRDEQQILDLLKRAHRQFYFRPSYIFKRMKKIRGLDDIKKGWQGIRMLMDI